MVNNLNNQLQYQQNLNYQNNMQPGMYGQQIGVTFNTPAPAFNANYNMNMQPGFNHMVSNNNMQPDYNIQAGQQGYNASSNYGFNAQVGLNPQVSQHDINYDINNKAGYNLDNSNDFKVAPALPNVDSNVNLNVKASYGFSG